MSSLEEIVENGNHDFLFLTLVSYRLLFLKNKILGKLCIQVVLQS